MLFHCEATLPLAFEEYLEIRETADFYAAARSVLALREMKEISRETCGANVVVVLKTEPELPELPGLLRSAASHLVRLPIFS